MNVVSLAEYVAAQKRGTIEALGGVGGSCPRCGHDCDFLVRSHGELYCANCAPRTKRCARCGHTLSVLSFDVAPNTKLGWRIESYCVECRRAKLREYYERAQRSDKPVASHQICRVCGRDKPRNAFDQDKRYAGGLETICQRCKNEQEYARGRAR